MPRVFQPCTEDTTLDQFNDAIVKNGQASPADYIAEAEALVDKAPVYTARVGAPPRPTSAASVSSSLFLSVLLAMLLASAILIW